MENKIKYPNKTKYPILYLLNNSFPNDSSVSLAKPTPNNNFGWFENRPENKNNGARIYNYTQCFRTFFDDNNYNVKLTEHFTDIERTLLLGKKSTHDSINGTTYLSDGLFETLDRNDMCHEELSKKEFCLNGMKYGNNNKLIFAGKEAYDKFCGEDEMYLGLQSKKLKLPYGTYTIILHPLFMCSYANSAIILDFICLTYRFKQRLWAIKDLEHNKKFFQTISGLMIRDVEKHVFVKNIK